jgi:hypothetical protein
MRRVWFVNGTAWANNPKYRPVERVLVTFPVPSRWAPGDIPIAVARLTRIVIPLVTEMPLLPDRLQEVAHYEHLAIG